MKSGKLDKDEKVILAIETSCDETAAAVLRGDLKSKSPKFEILSNVIRSQIKEHAKWGGVVPELAARLHIESISPVVQKALKDSSLNLEEVNAIAVTSGPGLIGSLLVGVEFAKGLAFSTKKLIFPTNHMEGHLYSALGEKADGKLRSIKQISYPLISLVVSGGHTMVVLMESENRYKVIGSTVDDAAGEAYDKVSKLMGLPYPGGPIISKLAAEGEPSIDFPRPMIDKNNFDFSFSGLKTAVRYYIENKGQRLDIRKRKIQQDIARSFEEAVVEVLITKTMRAAKKYKAKTISLTGGVSANIRLREAFALESKKNKISFIVPPMELCTDNAGMIAIAAYINLRAGKKIKKPEFVKADSSWEIS